MLCVHLSQRWPSPWYSECNKKSFVESYLWNAQVIIKLHKTNKNSLHLEDPAANKCAWKKNCHFLPELSWMHIIYFTYFGVKFLFSFWFSFYSGSLNRTNNLYKHMFMSIIYSFGLYVLFTLLDYTSFMWKILFTSDSNTK